MQGCVGAGSCACSPGSCCGWRRSWREHQCQACRGKKKKGHMHAGGGRTAAQAGKQSAGDVVDGRRRRRRRRRRRIRIRIRIRTSPCPGLLVTQHRAFYPYVFAFGAPTWSLSSFVLSFFFYRPIYLFRPSIHPPCDRSQRVAALRFRPALLLPLPCSYSGCSCDGSGIDRLIRRNSLAVTTASGFPTPGMA